MSVLRSNIKLFKFDKSDAVLSIDFVQAASATTASATASTLEPQETNRHISNLNLNSWLSHSKFQL